MNVFDENENKNIFSGSDDDQTPETVDYAFSKSDGMDTEDPNSVWSSSNEEADHVFVQQQPDDILNSFEESEYAFVQEDFVQNHEDLNASNTPLVETEQSIVSESENSDFDINTPELFFSSEKKSKKKKKPISAKKAARIEKKKNAPPKQRLRDDLKDLWEIILKWGKRTAISFFRKLKQVVHYLILFLPCIFLVASIIFSVICQIRIQDIKDRQYTQQAAQRWSGNTGVKFMQFSCFTRWKNAGDDTVAKPLSDVANSISQREMESIRAGLRKIVIQEEADILDKFDEAERERLEAEQERIKAEQTRIAQLAILNETDIAEETGETGETELATETAVETAVVAEIPIIQENQNLINERRIMYDAYSTESRAVIESNTEGVASSQVESMVTAVAGDYFLIHNMSLHSGSYLMENSQDLRRVVLDEGLAFSLFRSFNVTGSTVTINGEEFTINGVVAKNKSKEETASYGNFPRAYILFSEIGVLDSRISSTPDEELQKAGLPSGNQADPVSGNSVGDVSNYAVMCYEAVIPESLDGLSRQYLVRAFSESEEGSKNLEVQDGVPENFYVVENTNRYKFGNLWNNTFPLGANRIRLSQYTLPFWELAARQAGDVIFFWWIMFFIAIFTMIVSSCGTYCTFVRRRNGRPKIRRIKVKRRSKLKKNLFKKKKKRKNIEENTSLKDNTEGIRFVEIK